MVSCHPKIQESETISERGVDSVYAAYLNLTRSLPDSLGNTSAFIFPERDTAANTADVLDAPYLAIGKLTDTAGVFALSCSNQKDSFANLEMFKLDGRKWKLVGKYAIPFYVASIETANDSLGTYWQLISRPDRGPDKKKRFRYNSQTDRLE